MIHYTYTWALRTDVEGLSVFEHRTFSRVLWVNWFDSSEVRRRTLGCNS